MARVLSLVLVAEADRAVGRIGIFVLSRDAARRIAASIAKLPSLAAATKKKHRHTECRPPPQSSSPRPHTALPAHVFLLLVRRVREHGDYR